MLSYDNAKYEEIKGQYNKAMLWCYVVIVFTVVVASIVFKHCNNLRSAWYVWLLLIHDVTTESNGSQLTRATAFYYKDTYYILLGQFYHLLKIAWDWVNFPVVKGSEGHKMLVESTVLLCDLHCVSHFYCSPCRVQFDIL